MYINILKILVIFLIYNLAEAKIIQKINLSYVNKSEVIMLAEIKPSFNKKDDTAFVGISVPPEIGFMGIVTFSNGKSTTMLELSEGWVGENYVKWTQFTTEKASFTDTLQHATITIKFSPSFDISNREIEFSNGILKIKKLSGLYKIRNTFIDIPFSKGLRIEVDKDGIYQISGKMLKEHGVPIEKIDTKTYQLFCKGREVPLYIPDEHHKNLEEKDVLLFYGERLKKENGSFENYSFTNVYWLTWGERPGARVSIVSGGRRVDNTIYSSSNILNSGGFYDTLHLEEDNTLVWLGNITGHPPEQIATEESIDEEIDQWYWGYIGGSSLVNFTFTLPSPLPKGYAKLIVSLMGVSSVDSVNPDHNMQLYINNQSAGKNNNIVWDGQKSYLFETDTFSNSILQHGKNVLTFNLSSPFSDRSALNWIKVIYLRGYETIDDKISFSNTSGSYGKVCEYKITGFSSEKIELWDIKRNLYFKNFTVEKGSGKERDKYNLIFQDSAVTAAKYFAQCIDNRLVPLFLSLDTIKNLENNLPSVDYVVITTDSLRSELEPLINVHRERGLRALIVSIKDIYNRFSWGISEPESIKNFLKYLLYKFGSLPRYLLLAGDTTHDLDKYNKNRNIVPTHLSRISGWGPAADDGYFSLLKGDDLFPDICVGRFPAQNKEEMRSIVEKTIKYIKEPLSGFWRDNILILGGGEQVFTKFNNEIIEEVIETKMNIIRMDADPESYFYRSEFSAPRAIADCINSGVFLINFNGHGGSNIWSDNNFFSYTNLPLLHNGEWYNKGKFPVIFSFTCLTGFFESREYRSLGEEFLRLKRNGTVGFYGASAYTSRDGNFILNKIMLKKALNGEINTIGELINLCEIEMLLRNRSQYIPIVKQYNLLGDPSLPWKLTPDTLKFTRTEIDSQNIMHIEGICKPVDSGEVKLSVLSDKDIIERTIINVKDGKFSKQVTLKSGIKNIAGHIRAYAWNDSYEVRGWQSIIKDTVIVNNVKTEPSELFWGDSIEISCTLAGFTDNNNSASVYCLFAIGEREDPHISFSGIIMERKDSINWKTTSKIPLSFSAKSNPTLIVKFRTMMDGRNAESRLFLFQVNGLPDLMFKNNSLSYVWLRDTIFISSEVINCGTFPASPFSIVYLLKNLQGVIDTFNIIVCEKTLLPSESKKFFIPLPDTFGQIQIEAIVNPDNKIREVFTDNNKASGKIKLFYKDIKEMSDTLWLENMKIFSVRDLETTYRLYAIEDTINMAMPFLTKSRWRSKNSDNIPIKWIIRSRPMPSVNDSLLCSWEERLNVSINDNLLNKSDIVLFDTLLKKWRACGGVRTILENNKILINAKIFPYGNFATVDMDDVSPPEISATSYGKSLVNLEYRAKDRPLTIFLADPSGIFPSSIEFFLNKKKISSSMYSSASTSVDLNNITMSLYPESMDKIDSLHIVCYDLAGNRGERTFAYLPGSELSIRSFSCHPNPFTAKVHGDGSVSKIRFLFLLSDLANSVTLSIYTVSGKKIKTWLLNELIGLNMVEWDGRDESGFRIANGTYYAKLIAKNDKKKVKKVIRIAKLEGF